jgi:predicted porin
LKTRHIAFAAAVMSAGSAHAQSSVQLYGLLDLSVPSYITHADDAGNHVVGMGNGGEPWFSGSRWGVKGAEDIGNGAKIIFQLESEYRVSDGQMEDPGQIFDRDAWVGLQDGRLGKITVGFQNTIARDAAAIYGDPYGSAHLRTEEGGWTNSNNFKQLIFYSASATGTRSSNSIAWKKLFGNGLYLSAEYAFGNTTTFPTQSNYQVAAGYNGGAFNLSGFYNHTNHLGYTDQAYSFGGNYTFNIVRLNAGYFHYLGDQGTLAQRHDDAWTVSLKVAPKGPVDYELGYQQLRTRNAAYDINGDVPYANVGTFDLASGVHNGFKETLYWSAFYHLSKRTELYLAGDYMRLHGGYTVAQTSSSNQLELTTGIRTRF